MGEMEAIVEVATRLQRIASRKSGGWGGMVGWLQYV